MNLQNTQSAFLKTLLGLLCCGAAIMLLIGSGGTAAVPALMLLLIGVHFSRRKHVESVALMSTQLVVHYTRCFAEYTQVVALTTLTIRYVINGSLRSSKHYILELYADKKLLLKLSPKDGFVDWQIEKLHDELAKAITQEPY